MTIDPKAAELAKALADAVAAQNTPEYQELAAAAKRKEEIDNQAEKAAANQAFFYQEKFMPLREAAHESWRLGDLSDSAIAQGVRDGVFVGTPEPERYELPEDETATAKPNGGLSD